MAEIPKEFQEKFGTEIWQELLQVAEERIANRKEKIKALEARREKLRKLAGELPE